MKIDLYNNHEQYIKEQHQDWDIGRWLKSHGVTVQDLDKHPQIKDITLLINIRQEVWHIMNASEQATWGAYWNIVYKEKKSLKSKALKKFEIIAQATYQRQLKLKAIKQINQLKTSTSYQNIDQDNKAKGSCLPQVTSVKRDERECHVVPKGCVNHEVCDAHELWW